MATTSNARDIQKLYVEYLGRPADPAALEYWTGVLARDGAAGLTAMRKVLSESAEFTASFTGMSAVAAVDQLYFNLFGRHAEQPGLIYWSGKLTAGEMTISQILEVIGEAAQSSDLVALNSKITAAEAFTAAVDTAAEILGYSGATAAQLARAYISSITDAASLAGAIAGLPATVAQITGAALDHLPTGEVTVSGTASVGQTLTVAHTLADADGLGAVSYQWQAAGVNIAGATGSTFTLTDAQVGKPITVIASYVDGIGSHESVTSNVIASGDDTLKGSAVADTLAGSTGNDTYVVNVGGDVVVEQAGEGTDLVQVAFTTAGSYTLTANVENATVTSAANIAVSLTGNALDNVLTGNGAANTLTGGAGNDTLDGGAGADKLIGGSGDDTYIVGDSGDTVTELLNEGTDTVRTTLASHTLAANVENLVYTGTAAFTGMGNALNNVITGGNAGNKLDGGAGNDSLIGGTGADSLTGGLGNDTFVGAAGKDTLDGGDGTDLLQGLGNFADYTIARPNATDTVLTDKAGNVITVRSVETLVFADGVKLLAEVQTNIASVGNDKLTGTDGDDTINGGAGADSMAGGTGDDTYVIDNTGDVITELDAQGTDLAQLVLAAAGSYTLGNNVENATVMSAAGIAVNLTGNALDNVLTGNGAANTLTGGAGNDTLDGGAGADKLIGGSCDDTYIVADSGDTVTELLNEGTDTVRTTLASHTLAANVENLMYTSTAAFTGTGNALNNVITGGNAGNKLDGGAGNDSLIGGNGADSLTGGLGNDTFVGAAGKDTLDGGDGTDLLQGLGKFADYTFSRPNATDTVLTDKTGNVITVRGVESFVFSDGMKTLDDLQYNIASVGNDKLTGTDGDDLLNGGLGADTLTGGKGSDTYLIDNVGDVIKELDGEGRDSAQVALTAAGTYTLGDYVEDATITSANTIAVNLTGNALDNVLTGNGAANTLTGGGGNDTLDGGAGADKLVGGLGDDRYLVAEAGDSVTEGVGEGVDTVRTGLASYTLTANVENLRYTGSAAFTGTGNAQDNAITGGSGDNKLDGGAGNDTLLSGAGNDSLQGGLGDDVLTAGTGKDSIDGGAGADRLEGLGKYGDYTITRPNGSDTVLTDKAGNVLTVRNVESFIFADGAKDLLQTQYNIASIGNDTLYGTDGNDTLDGGAGADTLSGGLGDDVYIVDNVGDRIAEQGGKDQVKVALGAAGTYVMDDGVEDAIITAATTVAVNVTGNWMDNNITGNAAANTLTGGDGHDTLDGGAGADKLIGGTGDDVYDVADSGDTVTEKADEGTDTVRTTLASYALGANLENLSYTGKGAFSGSGNAIDNVLRGGDGGARLDGGAGNDTLLGGNGNDSLQGGTGDDTFYGSAGKDSMDGGAGDVDVLRGLGNFADYRYSRPNASDTVLTDKAGNTITVRNIEWFAFADGDKLLADLQRNVVSIANDVLDGTDGNDLLNGDLGADTMSGAGGDDTYVVDNAGDEVHEGYEAGVDLVQVAYTAAGTYQLTDFVENATVTAAAGVAVNLNGNWMDNVLTGNAAANTLNGGDGNDTLDGGAGADKLMGGQGDDLYIIDNAGDLVTESADSGSDSVQTGLASYTLSAHVENLRYTGKAAFTGSGNALDNVITGGQGGNKLDGGAGNDVLTGGAGNDSLQGGTGADTLYAATGKDTVDGGADEDVLQLAGNFADYSFARPNATDLVLTDKAGNVLTVRNVESFVFADGGRLLDDLQYNLVSFGNDKLYGSDGNDTINGLTGADTLTGYGGDDTYIVDNAGDQIIEGDGAGIDLVQVALTAAGTYTLADFVENGTVTAAANVAVNLNGNWMDNLLTGNAAANMLNGGDGHDTLDGGAGNDKLAGGTGDDIYIVADAGDVVLELVDEGHDTVRTGLASYTLAANVEDLRYTGKATFSGTGNALDNLLIGGDGGARLDGGAGNDTLFGGAGNDSLQGGLGDDVLNVSGGKDSIDGGAGADVLAGLGSRLDYSISRPSATGIQLTDKAGNVLTVSNVEWFGFADINVHADDLVFNIASPGADHLYGTAGDDTLDGGAGADTLSGGDGGDTYLIDNVGDVIEEVVGGTGVDTALVALASAGTYKLNDQVENATVTAAAGVAVNLTGNDLDNLLVGNAAANTLNGGAGDDMLDGGAGNDKLAGGSGDDWYVVTDSGDVVTELAGDGVDTVQTTLASYTLPVNVEVLVDFSKGNFTGTGNALANLMLAGSGGAKLDGGAGDDFLLGGAGNDSLQGGLGDDLFGATDGLDTIDGGAGYDELTSLGDYAYYMPIRINDSDIVLRNYAGQTITVRNVELFNFNGTLLTLAQLKGGSVGTGNDTVYGSSGNDILDGGPGNDLLIGGDGDDLYMLSAPGDIVAEGYFAGHDKAELAFAAAGTYTMAANLEDVLITGTAAVNVIGNEADNYIIGNSANNNLSGGWGDDTLSGGGGNDTLTGGSGNDVYFVTDAGDVVTERADEGIDIVSTSLASYTLGANVERLFYYGSGAFTGAGNSADNWLQAEFSSGAKLDGGAGNDTLIGSAGNDSLQGGAGDDDFLAAGGKDTIDGGAGADTVYQLAAFNSYTVSRPNATDTVLTDADGNVITVRNVETLYFADGALTLAEVQDNTPSVGADHLRGSYASDTLDGGAGADTMEGLGGDDVYVVDNLNDKVIELSDEGVDQVRLTLTSAGTYVLPENVERAIIVSTAAVSITGNSSYNQLIGNAAANRLSGGAGNDTLDGGAGNDTLVGGVDDDLYYIADSGDVVTELLNEGHDLVLVTAATYTLAANVEDMRYTGTGSFKGTGNALANLITNNGNGGTLDGGAGNDTLYGSVGNDSLLGGAGDDTLQVTAGNDTVDGGAGNDLLQMRDYASSYTVARPNATDLVLTDQEGNSVTLRNIESLMFNDVGMVTPDYFKSNVASSGNDVLLGTDGNDYINGLGGADDMTGGAGNDVYTVDVAGDVIHEAAGGGIDTVNVAFAGAATYVLPDDVENAVIVSSAAINLSGNNLDNRLVGNAAANTLTGGNGDDTYVVGAGDKVVELAGGGTDTVETALASYTLGAHVENLRYTGSAAFTGIGNELANVLRGGAGADKLTGGGGSDTFVFENLAGSDTVTDFVSGTDQVQFSMAAFDIGNGNTTIDAALVRATPGGFSNASELVMFTQRMTTASAANAAAIIGSADSAYGAGSTALFAVATNSATVLYRFVSANNDALVSASELTQVAVLTGTPTANLDDYSFIA